MNNLVDILMAREDMTREEVIAWIREAAEDMSDPEELLYEEFGLEPDYIFDLLDLV